MVVVQEPQIVATKEIIKTKIQFIRVLISIYTYRYQFISDKETGNVRFACSGSIVAKRVVLTAAHCALAKPEGYKLYVYLLILNYMDMVINRNDTLHNVGLLGTIHV